MKYLFLLIVPFALLANDIGSFGVGGNDIGAYEAPIESCIPPTAAWDRVRCIVDSAFSLTPSVTGTPDSLVLIGTLPAGLSFSKSTGVISGTPDTALDTTDYTVTLYKSGCANVTENCTLAVIWGPALVDSVYPDTLYWGDTGTLCGRGFGPSQDTGELKIDDTVLVVTAWANTLIKWLPPHDTGRVDTLVVCKGDQCDTLLTDSFYIAGARTPTYALTMANTSPAGTVTPAAGDTTVDSNSVITITHSPPPGYTFVCWTRSNASCPFGDSTASTTTITVRAICTVAPTILIKSYTLTISADPGASTTPSGEITADSGVDVNISATITSSDSEAVGWEILSGSGQFDGDSSAFRCFEATEITYNTRIKAPTISYAGSPAICSTTVAFSLAATTGVPGVKLAIDALPTGLSLNASTGAITGTPTTVTAKAGYAIRDSNSTAIDTTVCTLTVVVGKPHIALRSDTIRATVGQTITPDTAFFTGGARDSVRVDEAFLDSLAFDTAKGIISGKPLVDTTYTRNIVVYNGSGTDTAAVTVIVQNPSAARSKKRNKWDFSQSLRIR